MLTGEALSTPAVHLSEEAARYARNHRLWRSFVIAKSLVLCDPSPVESVDVDLLRDPEATNTSVICFTVHTSAGVPEILEFDERLRNSVIDHVPVEDQIHFTFRFDFD